MCSWRGFPPRWHPGPAHPRPAPKRYSRHGVIPISPEGTGEPWGSRRERSHGPARGAVLFGAVSMSGVPGHGWDPHQAPAEVWNCARPSPHTEGHNQRLLLVLKERRQSKTVVSREHSAATGDKKGQKQLSKIMGENRHCADSPRAKWTKH